MENLAAARADFAARAHATTSSRPDRKPLLDADDLSALGEASWWLGLMDGSLVAAEEAYTLYLEASNNRRAAFRALKSLTRRHCLRVFPCGATKLSVVAG